LNGHIFSPDLLSMIEFNITNHRLRNSNLLHVSFHKNNYSSTSFFPRALKQANIITDHVDFFFIYCIVFNRNIIYLALNSFVN
jgi:hypothetical protein